MCARYPKFVGIAKRKKKGKRKKKQIPGHKSLDEEFVEIETGIRELGIGLWLRRERGVKNEARKKATIYYI